MYLPSLITPWLISRLGLSRVMLMGTACLAITLVVGLAGQHYLHYWISMAMLGVGWNFLFVSGTTMLTQTYRPDERFKAQATNDFSVFATSATASLLAGSVLHTFGWSWLLITALPALVLMLIAIVWVRAAPIRASG
jgi:MFS family permease